MCSQYYYFRCCTNNKLAKLKQGTFESPPHHDEPKCPQPNKQYTNNHQNCYNDSRYSPNNNNRLLGVLYCLPSWCTQKIFADTSMGTVQCLSNDGVYIHNSRYSAKYNSTVNKMKLNDCGPPTNYCFPIEKSTASVSKTYPVVGLPGQFAAYL